MINSGKEWNFMDDKKKKMNKVDLTTINTETGKPLALWFSLVLILAWTISFIGIIWLANLSN